MNLIDISHSSQTSFLPVSFEEWFLGLILRVGVVCFGFQ